MVEDKEISEQDAEMWADAMKSIDDYQNECDRINDRILIAIKNQLGLKFMIAVEDCAKESQVEGAFSLVRKPSGNYYEEDWDSFKGIWVSQRSVGDSGDSWVGEIYIKLKERLYLEMSYSM